MFLLSHWSNLRIYINHCLCLHLQTTHLCHRGNFMVRDGILEDGCRRWLFIWNIGDSESIFCLVKRGCLSKWSPNARLFVLCVFCYCSLFAINRLVACILLHSVVAWDLQLHIYKIVGLDKRHTMQHLCLYVSCVTINLFSHVFFFIFWPHSSKSKAIDFCHIHVRPMHTGVFLFCFRWNFKKIKRKKIIYKPKS